MRLLRQPPAELGVGPLERIGARQREQLAIQEIRLCPHTAGILILLVRAPHAIGIRAPGGREFEDGQLAHTGKALAVRESAR